MSDDDLKRHAAPGTVEGSKIFFDADDSLAVNANLEQSLARRQKRERRQQKKDKKKRQGENNRNR